MDIKTSTKLVGQEKKQHNYSEARIGHYDVTIDHDRKTITIDDTLDQWAELSFAEIIDIARMLALTNVANIVVNVDKDFHA